jgi:predicted Zn-dependent protease
LITHFWYVNYLNPMKTEVTGTTRDGTFLIEKGKITQAVRDMRIEQSILEMLNHVEMVGKDLSLYQQYGATLLVPLVKIGNFKLTKGN